MLGMFSLLPLLKGWDYKVKVWTRTVKRGEMITVERLEDIGWLMILQLATNDAYGGFELSGQGADLGLVTLGSTHPKAVYDIGGWVQDPAGWVQLYYKPNPQSSLGAFLVVSTSQSFQGSTLPYVPTTILKLYLLAESTQTEATVSVSAGRVIITDKKQFIKSLRSVMGMPTIQDIDPALLVAGLQEITQKGEFDKEKKEKP